MIEIKNVCKIYSQNTGNFDITFNVNDKEVFGIIGPNGSGKTTLIRQILGFIKPDSGQIQINKLVEPWTKREEMMDFTGYVAGEISLFNYMSGIEYLKIVATTKKNVDWEFVEKLIEHFELNAKTKIKKC